jgi:hypothetical protein
MHSLLHQHVTAAVADDHGRQAAGRNRFARTQPRRTGGRTRAAQLRRFRPSWA